MRCYILRQLNSLEILEINIQNKTIILRLPSPANGKEMDKKEYW